MAAIFEAILSILNCCLVRAASWNYVDQGKAISDHWFCTDDSHLIEYNSSNSYLTEHTIKQLCHMSEPLMTEWLEQASQWHEMYCDDLGVMSSNPCRVKTWGPWYFCPKSHLNQTYQLPVHQSIWEPVHAKSPQTSNIITWQYMSFLKSVMAKWLKQESQWHEVYCHDQGVMSSNSGRVELGVLGISVLSRTWTKHKQWQNGCQNTWSKYLSYISHLPNTWFSGKRGYSWKTVIRCWLTHFEVSIK